MATNCIKMHSIELISLNFNQFLKKLNSLSGFVFDIRNKIKKTMTCLKVKMNSTNCHSQCDCSLPLAYSQVALPFSLVHNHEKVRMESIGENFPESLTPQSLRWNIHPHYIDSLSFNMLANSTNKNEARARSPRERSLFPPECYMGGITYRAFPRWHYMCVLYIGKKCEYHT